MPYGGGGWGEGDYVTKKDFVFENYKKKF